MLLSLMKKNGLNLARLFAQTPLLAQEICGPKGCSILKAPVSRTTLQLLPYSSTKLPSTKSDTETPYKNTKQKRYGYEIKHFTGGLLPRLDNDKPLKSLKAFKIPDNWEKKKALFGQNDYIDILGDGNIHPKDLIRGPSWLKGFKGNEMQRLIRRIKFEGNSMSYYYPTKYHNIRKRIRYLYKFYNHRRHKTNY